MKRKTRRRPPASAAAAGDGKLNPAALTRAQLVKILTAAGGKVTVADVDKDRAAGAPANADGTIHLVHYTAWLASQAD